MEVAGLAAVGDARDLVDRAVIPRLPLFRILNHLVNEVAEVKHEIEPVARGRAFVFEDHAAVGVQFAFVDVLAADEGEVHRPRVVRQRRGDGAADAAAVAVRVGESIPIDPRRLEAADEHPGRPIGRRRNRSARLRHDPAEPLVFGDFDRQYLALALLEGPAGPQETAVGLGIARCDAFREQVASLPPVYLRTRARRSAQRQSRAVARRERDELSSCDHSRRTPFPARRARARGRHSPPSHPCELPAGLQALVLLGAPARRTDKQERGDHEGAGADAPRFFLSTHTYPARLPHPESTATQTDLYGPPPGGKTFVMKCPFPVIKWRPTPDITRRFCCKHRVEAHESFVIPSAKRRHRRGFPRIPPAPPCPSRPTSSPAPYVSCAWV